MVGDQCDHGARPYWRQWRVPSSLVNGHLIVVQCGCAHYEVIVRHGMVAHNFASVHFTEEATAQKFKHFQFRSIHFPLVTAHENNNFNLEYARNIRFSAHVFNFFEIQKFKMNRQHSIAFLCFSFYHRKIRNCAEDGYYDSC
jgi:hypothetical protein